MKLNQTDIDFLLTNILNPTPSNPQAMSGLRDPSGHNNNLLPGKEGYGAADENFLIDTHQIHAQSAEPIPDGLPFGPAAGTPTAYNNTDSWIADSRPREISNLVSNQSDFIPNIPTLTVAQPINPLPFSGWMTLFGQFFDHGLDLVHKGDPGNIIIPLLPNDPLYSTDPGANNFMIVPRANFTVDGGGNRDYVNTVSPFIDQNQTYGSHPGMTVFLREYDNAGHATGRLVSGADGGMATWADVKANALKMGITLTDQDVLNLPEVQLNADGTYAGSPGNASLTGNRIGHAFLDDIAHGATPASGLTPDPDNVAGNVHSANTYDDELLDAHYIGGDGRANENFGLTAVHSVFHNEHNRVLSEIKQLMQDRLTNDPTFNGGQDLTGEQYFQAAKLVTETQYQHMVFEEFVRRISPDVALFSKYNVNINPQISLEFSQAVYRFGHSMLTENIDRIDGNGNFNQTDLISAFLNPLDYANNGNSEAFAAAIATGMSRQVGNEIDEFVTGALRNNLVGLPLDLAAINIARGRDVGVPTLNAVREDLFAQTGDSALQPYTSWDDFGNHLLHPASLKNFIMAYAGAHILSPADLTLRDSTIPADQAAYAAALDAAADTAMADPDFMNNTGNAPAGADDFNLIDFWLGGLAEQKVDLGMLGSTFNFIFAAQMVKLQDADRLYYLGRLDGTNLLSEIEGQTFSDIIMRNTGATHLYAQAMVVPDAFVEMGGSNSDHQQGYSLRDDLQKSGNPLQSSDPRFGTGYHFNLATFTGTGFSEMIGGTNVADTIRGGLGNDTIYGDGGNDNIDGQKDNDFVYGGDGNDVITDSSGDDFIRGEAGNDSINGGVGIDTLYGGDGIDVMRGGSGADIMDGGEGDDQLFGDQDDDTILGGLGVDTINGGIGADRIRGGEGNDVITGGEGSDNLQGDGGDDLFIQSPGDIGFNHVFDGDGFLLGQGGIDTVTYASALSGINVDLGNTVIKPVIPGNPVPDVFRFIENLIGSSHNDIMRNTSITASDNVMDGGLGADQMSAGLGNDTYIVDSTGDVITEAAGQGIDTIRTALNSYTLPNGTGKAVENLVFIGTSGGFAGTGNGLLNVLSGGSEADTLLGLGGNDTLNGLAGNDLLDGGLGNDVMTGGDGDDTYVINAAGDIVTEVAGQGTDRVQSAVTFTLATRPDIENLTLTGAANTNGTGNGSINILIGNDGANILKGNAGADMLTGGLGADQFSYAVLSDSPVGAGVRDQILDFDSGNDKINLNAMDANLTVTGNQNFAFIGSAAFTAPGQVRYAGGLLEANVGGTNGTAADFQIELVNAPALIVSDLSL